MPISGIYRISCRNGDYYYGSAVDIDRRYTRHLWNLKRGDHPNPRLQNVWNKYGAASLKLDVIETLPKSQLLEVEQTYLDKHVGIEECMNINPLAHGGCGPLSEEHKRKIGEANKRVMSKALKGHKISEETKRKISESVKKYRAANPRNQPRDEHNRFVKVSQN